MRVHVGCILCDMFSSCGVVLLDVKQTERRAKVTCLGPAGISDVRVVRGIDNSSSDRVKRLSGKSIPHRIVELFAAVNTK